MRISKKILAIALSILMAVSMMPFTVFAATTGVADGAALKTAIASAADGDVIEFTADNTTYPATSGALVIPVDGKNITIDLKGHTQYFRVSGETAVSYPTDLFVLKNGAKLTVKDSVGGGAIYATYGANSAAYMFNVLDTSELVIDSGKYVMDKANRSGVIIYQNSADASTTINDGEFETVTNTSATRQYRDYIINNSRGEVEINGGTFTTGKSSDYVISEGNTTDTTLIINGGTFNGTMSLDTTKATTELNGGTYKTNDGAANTVVSKYLPADEVIDSTTGQIKDVDANTVARIDSTEFTSLADAVAACTNTSSTTTITMVKDTTEAAPITISNGAKITINANGCEVTCTDRVFIIRHGQLTFNNGTIYSTTDDGVAVYGAATDSGSNYSTFTLGTNAVINAPNYFGAMIGNNNGGAYGAKITISSTAVVNSKYGIYINGSVAEPETKTNAAAISITGTINGDNAEPAIYAAGYAKWTIGGTSYTANITAGSGIYIKSGDMTITNANITAVGQKADYVFNANGADGTGDAIIIDSCGYPGNIPTVTIKGGTITSANGEAVASYAKQDDPRYPDATYPVVDQVIPGTSTAVFSSDVSALAADGYETKYDETAGGYVVEEDTHTVAKIGNAKYNTFEAAWNAAQDGDTITLVKDCAGNGLQAPQGKYTQGLTVDFNGCTYTIDGTLVGSPNTQSQAFQLLKDNTITFKNGTIYSEKARMLVQNYSNLTLDNMTLTLNNTTTAPASVYTLSNNNGDVVIKDTTINANPVNTAFAFDVCRYSSYPSVNVTVTGNSVVNGDVEIYASKSDPKNGFSLTLESGSMNGDIVVDATAENVLETTPAKAEITKAAAFTQAAPEGYAWLDNGNNTYTLGRVPADEVSITTADRIEVNVYLDDTSAEKTVEYTFNGSPTLQQNNPKTETVDFDSLPTVDGKKQLTIVVAPAQIRDDIDIDVKDESGAVIRSYDNYSVAAYCDEIVAGDYAANVQTLAKSVLDYGKAASAFFDYNTAAFANVNYNFADFEFDTTGFTASATGITIDEVRYVATSVPSLRFKVDMAEADAAKLTAETDKGYEAKFVKTDDGDVVLQVTGIPAAKLGETITITVSDGAVIEYTPLVYAYMAAKANNAELAKLGKTIGQYSTAANAVFA